MFHTRLFRLLNVVWALVALPLLGVLQAWALADGQGQARWWAQVLALAGFFLFLDGSRSVWQAARRGWWFAMCWLAAVFWWIFISLHVHGGLHALLAAAAVAAVAAALGLYYALAAALYWRWRVRSLLGSALQFAACWTLAELARGQWLTGFPWGAVGYAHVDGPLAWLARWVGVYGVGAAAALLAALAALALVSVLGYIFGRFIGVPRLPVSAPQVLGVYGWLALLAVGVYGGGAWQQRQFALADAALQGRQPVSLALLQGNIPVAEKFDPQTGVAEALRWYGQRFLERKEDLVIAPETAIPLFKRDLPPGYFEAIAAPYRQGGQAMMTGLPRGNAQVGYTNSVEAIKPGVAGEYVYSKSHLVLMGEFTPAWLQWFNDLLEIPLDSFSRGAVVQPSFEWKGERFAPNICYEDLFGEELAQRFVQPQQAPTVLVNFTNVGWFGDGVMVDQHLHISRMRALELERPMVRATNTGATAIIDHRARVLAQAPRTSVQVLTGQVVGVGQSGDVRDVTPFARWAGRLGLWPMWALALVLLLGPVALARAMRRRRRSGAGWV